MAIGLGILLCEFKPTKLKKAVYLTVCFGFMFLLSAFRYGIGFDWGNYLMIYSNAKGRALFDLSYWDVEKGWLLLNNIVSRLSGNDYGALVAVVSAFITLSAAVFIYRFSERPWISVYLYITLVFFYGSMNYLRQYLTLAVFLYAYGFLIKPVRGIKEIFLWFIPYAAVIALASCFHVVALVALPVYFIVRIPPSRASFIFYGAAAAAAHLLLNPALNFAYTHLGSEFGYYKDSKYVEPLSIVFIVLPAVFCILAVLYSKKLCEKYGPAGRVSVNFTCYAFLFWSFAMRAMILERFSMYFYIAVLLLIPQILGILEPAAADMKAAAAKLKAAGTARGTGTQNRAVKAEEELDRLSSRRAAAIAGLSGIIALTMLYHGFCSRQAGIGVHGAFPYKSRLEFLETVNMSKNDIPVWWPLQFELQYDSMTKDWKKPEVPECTDPDVILPQPYRPEEPQQ